MRFLARAFPFLLLAACDGFIGETRIVTSRPSTVATSSSKPLHVGGEVKAPVVVKRVEPDVKRCTIQKIHVSGSPVLELVIDEWGVPRDIRILKSSHPCIDQVVMEAARQWRFRPGTLRGKPVPVVFNMIVHLHFE